MINLPQWKGGDLNVMLFFGFQGPSPAQQTCSAARAPVPVCRDTGFVTVKGTVQTEAMSSPQQAAVRTMMGSLGRNPMAAASDICFCATHHVTFSLTFPVPGLVDISELIRWGVVITVVEQPL